MSLKKKIKRKCNRIKQAKKAGATPLPSTSKVRKDTSRSHKKHPVKSLAGFETPPPGGVDTALERARLEGIRTGLQYSSVNMLARAVGSFISGLNSCPKCDEPLPSGRYRIKCKCGYCRVGNTRELNSDLLIVGIVAAAFGAVASLVMSSELNSSNKDSSKSKLALLPEYTRNNVINFTGDRKDKSPSYSGPTITGNELFDLGCFDKKNKDDKSNVISISVESGKKKSPDGSDNGNN